MAGGKQTRYSNGNNANALENDPNLEQVHGNVYNWKMGYYGREGSPGTETRPPKTTQKPVNTTVAEDDASSTAEAPTDEKPLF